MSSLETTLPMAWLAAEGSARGPAVRAGGEEHVFLRGLIQGMRCGILTIDHEGRVVLLNDLARRTLGLDRMPPRGVPVATVLSANPQLSRVLLESFRMSSLPARAELDLESGKRIGFTVSMIRQDDGEPCGAAVFFKDLTQIEHKEEQERIKDRLAALGQMAASLAHEIRNPLASIEVTCTLLRRRLGTDADSVELLQKITREVQRLNSTVNTSLEFVRPVNLDLEVSELQPVLDEAIQVATGRRGTPGIVVDRSYARMPPFLMDRILLRQVFENLILNAMEAVGTRGRVTVATEIVDTPGAGSVPYQPAGSATGDPWQCAEQCVVVRVKDDGPGIGEEDLDRIFYPLFTTKKQGSGIGLAVVRKIVNSHRGLIDIDSSPGAGAEFSVRLPMALQTAEV